MALNVEFATSIPIDAEVKAFKAGLGRIEKARIDYAATVGEVAASLGVPRSALLGSRVAAAEILTARFFANQAREPEQR